MLNVDFAIEAIDFDLYMPILFICETASFFYTLSGTLAFSSFFLNSIIGPSCGNGFIIAVLVTQTDFLFYAFFPDDTSTTLFVFLPLPFILKLHRFPPNITPSCALSQDC